MKASEVISIFNQGLIQNGRVAAVDYQQVLLWVNKAVTMLLEPYMWPKERKSADTGVPVWGLEQTDWDHRHFLDMMCSVDVTGNDKGLIKWEDVIKDFPEDEACVYDDNECVWKPVKCGKTKVLKVLNVLDKDGKAIHWIRHNDVGVVCGNKFTKNKTRYKVTKDGLELVRCGVPVASEDYKMTVIRYPRHLCKPEDVSDVGMEFMCAAIIKALELYKAWDNA